MWQPLINWLFPSRCLMCQERISQNSAQLCSLCIADLPFIEISSISPNLLYRPDISRLFPVTHFDDLWALAWYEAPFKHWLTNLKFHNKIYLSTALEQLLWQRFAAFTQHPEFIWPDVIIILPLHSKRFKLRGFNQVSQTWHRFLVQDKIREDLLVRQKPTQPQSKLTAASRKQNVATAFSCTQEAKGLHIALIDDVITTGATANAAALCLKQAGAKRISLWVTCITPLNS